MKKIILFSALALFLSAMGGCEKDEKKTVKRDGKLEIRNFSRTDCKQDADYIGNLAQESKKEYLELKSDGKYLKVKHINAQFNCCPEEIVVTSKISNNTIYIDENEKSHACDCICDYDLDYEIGELDYSNYYVVLTKLKAPFSYKEFELDFNANVNKRIYVEYKNK